MAFLTKTPGQLHQREAREICDLDILIHEALTHGPLTIEQFARVRCKSDRLDAWERNARDLAARVRSRGFRVELLGDGANLRVDFSVDRELRAEVERVIDDAREKCRNVSVHFASEAAEPNDDEHEQVSAMAMRGDHALGLSIRRLCRRYRIGAEKVQILLRATGCPARREGRPRVEDRRDEQVIEQALGERGWGSTTRVAEILGVHRNTARSFLRRVRDARERLTGGDHAG